MNREPKVCSHTGRLLPIEAFADKWKKGRQGQKYWDPNLREDQQPYCIDAAPYNTTSKKSVAEQQLIVEAVRLDQKQYQGLYLISVKGDKLAPDSFSDDLKALLTQVAMFKEKYNDLLENGYVGIGDANRRNSSLKSVSNQLGIDEDNLQQEFLFEGIQEDCDLTEKILRPRAGMGWNFQQGASVGNGIYSQRGAASVVRRLNPGYFEKDL